MKTILAFLLLLCYVVHAAVTPTPYTFQFTDANGNADTNYTTMQGWPVATGSASVVSNVVVFSGPLNLVTNQFIPPFTLGTNSAMPGNYRVFCPANGVGFLVSIPATTNQLPLSIYAVGVPVVYASSSLYFYLTNALGFQPLPATLAAVIAQLGFQPATNTTGSITNLLGGTPIVASYSSISNVLGFVIATNGGALAYSQLPYTPPTNTLAGITNAIGYRPATNGAALAYSLFPYLPATNPPAGFAFTGTLGYTNRSGTGSTLYVTNGVVSTNTTP